MDRKFKLGDSVHVIKSEQSGVVDAIDTSFGVAVFYVQYDDHSEPCEWFAAHELELQTLRLTPYDWLRRYLGSRLASRLARAAQPVGVAQRVSRGGPE